MNPEPRPLRATALGRGGVVFVAATALALIAAQIMLAPPPGDLVELGIYLVASGFITVALGALLIRVLERYTRLTLLARFVLVTFVGSAVLVLNIVVLARLMFISTDHDLRVLLATAIFGAIVAGSFTTWAAAGTIARISQINAGIRDLAAGSLGVTTGVTGRDEVAALAGDVDALSRRLAEAHAERVALDTERKELTAAISHDLRTPLSTIRAMVDALEDGVVSEPVEMKRYFATIRRDLERLNRMIDDLFELAQIDAGVMRLQPQSITIQEIVAEVVDGMSVRAERAGVQLTVSVKQEPPTGMLDADRLERAIANLLQNAIEHTSAGGQVCVLVDLVDGQAVVEVSDTGEGIDDDDLPHVWTRFYRAERSRTRTDAASGGVGLGLAITKEIVELHGGRVDVRSTRGAGSAFKVVLPVETV